MTERLVAAWKAIYPHMTDEDWSRRSLDGVRGNRAGAAQIILACGGHVEPYTDDARQMLADIAERRYR